MLQFSQYPKGGLMSQFEFLFSLYSLLLGFSLVELLSGLGKTLKSRLNVKANGGNAFRIGWLTPLLGLFVMLDLLSFWSAAWTARDMLSVSGATLMSTMLFASAYYLAAHLVFPDEPEKINDLDNHYFSVRRVVIAVLFILLLVQLVFYASNAQLLLRITQPFPMAMTAILIVLMLSAFIFKNKSLNIAALAALIARYVFIYAL
jgi:hypothetical protein